MKRSIKIAVAAALALSGTSAFATNGDHLIGMGAKARGMGGIGIGMSHGAETALSNPALITSVKGSEVSFGGTVFMPDVATNMGAGYSTSDADLSVIPEVAIASKVSDNFYVGVGMFGVAGMGTDYRDATGYTSNMNMVTNLQLMQFAVPLAYKVDAFSFGIAPVLQYGSLDINYDMTGMMPGATSSQTQGVAQDFGYGYNVGVAFSEEGLTVGASYKSAIDMVYKGQISSAADQFNLGDIDGNPATANNVGLSDHLEQPAEMGVGASYAFGGNTIAFDYKRINWSDAKGYKDFGWDDQDVYIIGYQFAQDNWALRAGYNYAKSPIKAKSAASMMTPGDYDGAVLNTLNLLGFPAIVEEHYTIGASYAFNKMTSIDLAYVYVPEVTETFDNSALMQAVTYANGGDPTGVTSSVSTKHSQDALSFQVNFAF
ncbi:OmpP1/FadL family transporter [Sulfuricurvum sp.]|uniref:OmpP1/FadL family transporter n=1 Tax=Sulfuricurvum sp. TaxID=2025608 RepID=UPI003C3895E6